jgi:hypothetical protein
MIRLALGASAVAVFMGWLAWTQFNRANAASEALRASQNALRVTAETLVREAEAAHQWRGLFEELADAPQTNTCGPVFDRGGDVLRQRRANTP